MRNRMIRVLVDSKAAQRLRDILERRKDRVLHFRLYSHLYYTRRILRELGRDELQDLLLAHEIGGLLVCARIFEPLI